jgi:hypothetical protein
MPMKINSLLLLLNFIVLSPFLIAQSIKDEIEQKLSVKLFATSSKVEEYSRVSWNEFYISIQKHKKRLGEITPERFGQTQEIYLDLVLADKKFVDVLVAFESFRANLYLVDPSNKSPLVAYEKLYVAILDDLFFAFTDRDSFQSIVMRRNLEHEPISLIYQKLDER